MDEQILYWLGLSHTLISGSVLVRIVESLGSAQTVWNASEGILQKYLKTEQIERLMKARETLQLENLLEKYQEKDVQLLPFTHPEYPDLLKQTHDFPFLLYIQGSLSVLNHPCLAIVGTRRFTDYGRRAVNTLVEQIAPFNPCIVSGLAAGIDTLAHQAALQHQLPTVAVFGTGLDKIYPRENGYLAKKIVAEGGCLASELPLGMRGDTFTFPKRNRIIAGLSQGTLVIEGNPKSGDLITAKFALEENRQLMAIPGNIFSETAMGPNQLIQQGATPVHNGQDIAQAMGWDVGQDQATQLNMLKQVASDMLEKLSPLEREVFITIGDEPISFDEIQSRKKECSIMDLQTTLTMLELQGLITALPGAKFSRN